jgi:hypothetical protein
MSQEMDIKKKRGPGRPSKKAQIIKNNQNAFTSDDNIIDDTLCLKFIN